MNKARCCIVIMTLSLSGCGPIIRGLASFPTGTDYQIAEAIDKRLVMHPPTISLHQYQSVQNERSRPWQRGDLAVAVAASGGGYRAANLTLGVLLGLERLRLPGLKYNLLQEVDYFSTVSGSGFAIGLYLSRYLHHLGSAGIRVPFNFAKDLQSGDFLARLRFNFANYLFFGPRRTNLLETMLANLLTQSNPHRELYLGDLFVAKHDRHRVPILPMWITNATIIQNSQLFQFAPDVITRYKIWQYRHKNRLRILQNLDSNALYGFDMPAAVGMLASATFPFAITGTTLASYGCQHNCFLHLFDGGLVDNQGILTAVDLLRQDKAKKKLLIIIDAYNSGQEPFALHPSPPKKLALFNKIINAISSSFQLNIKHQANNIVRDILCENGTKQILVVYLNLNQFKHAREIPTSLWMTHKEQDWLIEKGQKIVLTNPILKNRLSAMLQKSQAGRCPGKD